MAKGAELTDKEVLIIHQQARTLDPTCYHLPRIKTDVTRISKAGLIFIEGDRRIGNRHISERHNAIEKHYRKMFLPTEFDLSMAPVNYHVLADEIFLQGYKNVTGVNTVYTAYLHKAISKHEHYKLVLFRDTKIVLTMYPMAAMEPRPKFSRSFWGSVLQDLTECTTTIDYMFLNHEEKSIFYLKVSLNALLSIETSEIFIIKKGKPDKKIYEKISPLTHNADNIIFYVDTLEFPEEEKFVNEYQFT